MIKKPIFKSTFLKTLEAIPDEVSFIYDLLKNWERNPNTLLADAYRLLDTKSNIEIKAHASNVTICLIEAKNYKNYARPPISNFILQNTLFHKPPLIIRNPIPHDVYEERHFNVENRYIDPLLYETFHFEITELTYKIKNTVILNTGFQLSMSQNIMKEHPIMPISFVDINVPQILCTYTPEITHLLAFLLSIEVDSSIQESSDYQAGISAQIEDYRTKIFDLDKRIATRLLMKYYTDHHMKKNRCRHCLLKHIKVNKIVTISIGNPFLKGLEIDIEPHNESQFKLNIDQACVIIKQKLFTKNIHVFMSDIVGSNADGENLKVSIGAGHLNVMPHVPSYFNVMLPHYSQFLAKNIEDINSTSPLYQFCHLRELINTDILIESAWDKKEGVTSERVSLQKSITYAKSSSHLSKYGRKQSNYFILSDEMRILIDIYEVELNINLNKCTSKLLESIFMIQQSIGLASSFMPKKSTKSVKFKSKDPRFNLVLNSAHIVVNFDEYPLEIKLERLKINKSPKRSVPDLIQTTIEKNKEISITFQNELKIKCKSLSIGFLTALSIKICEVAAVIEMFKETKAKESNGELILN